LAKPGKVVGDASDQNVLMSKRQCRRSRNSTSLSRSAANVAFWHQAVVARTSRFRPSVEWEARLGRRLKLRDLQILSMVVQWGSMTKGAARLGMSQPAVSEAIANLEGALEVPLLDRSPRGIEPTIYTHALLKRGHVVFDELKQGIRDIEFLADPSRGEIRIGCPESLAAGFVPAIVDRLMRRHPQISVHVVAAQPGEQEFRELRERSVDLLLGRVFRPLSVEDVAIEALCDDAFFVVAGAGSQWAKRRKIVLSELMEEPWILFPANSLSNAYIADAFRARGLELPGQALRSFSLQMRLHLLATGRFLTALHGSVLRFNADAWRLKALPIDLIVRPMPIALFTLKNRSLSPVVQLFVEEAKQVANATLAAFRRTDAGVLPPKPSLPRS
jgi:DNA-binding transcriptional LysR family regulator